MDGNMSEHDHGEAGASPCGVMNGHHGHGSLEGHVLPGSMFVLWSAWWMLNIFSCYLTSSPRKPFLGRSWYPFPWAKHIPLEPLVKVGLTFIGVIVELVVAGHGTPRKLIKDGCFVTEHLNNWQHAVMYGAFMLSGLVDLVGFYTAVPRGTEQAFLTMAFFNEGILMAFHLKGTDLDKRLHFILALIIFACALFCALEAAWPQNNTLAAGKAAVLMLQGSWFIQVGVILYTHKTWWDPGYGGADMFVPVVLVWHVLIIMSCMLAVFLLMQRLHGNGEKGSRSYAVLVGDKDKELVDPAPAPRKISHLLESGILKD